jgi:hypothetical protein
VTEIHRFRIREKLNLKRYLVASELYQFCSIFILLEISLVIEFIIRMSFRLFRDDEYYQGSKDNSDYIQISTNQKHRDSAIVILR